MSTIFDYLDWRGDLTLDISPFNEVDNLVLSTLIYSDLPKLLPEVCTGDGLSIKECAALLDIREMTGQQEISVAERKKIPVQAEEPDNDTDLVKEPDNNTDLVKEPDNKKDLAKESDNQTDLAKEPDNKNDQAEEPCDNTDRAKEPDNKNNRAKEPNNNNSQSKEPKTSYTGTARKLLKKMAASKRFGDVRLFNCSYLASEMRQVQFGALSILLSDASVYVAFRGTDRSIIGWREDLNLSYMEETEGQRLALAYLNMTGARFDKIRVGGHSKGGNLAIYAAVRCESFIRDRLLSVYCNDGPGFFPEFTKTPEYQTLIPKMLTILPESSMVGILMQHDEPVVIVKSSEKGMDQHDPATWQVLGTHFIEAPELSKSSRKLNENIMEWLTALSPDEREAFVDSVFEYLALAGIHEVGELKNIYSLSNIRKFISFYRSNSKEENAQLIEPLKELWRVIRNPDDNEDDPVNEKKADKEDREEEKENKEEEKGKEKNKNHRIIKLRKKNKNKQKKDKKDDQIIKQKENQEAAQPESRIAEEKEAQPESRIAEEKEAQPENHIAVQEAAQPESRTAEEKNDQPESRTAVQKND